MEIRPHSRSGPCRARCLWVGHLFSPLVIDSTSRSDFKDNYHILISSELVEHPPLADSDSEGIFIAFELLDIEELDWRK